MTSPSTNPTPDKPQRKKALTIVAAVVLLGGAAYAAYYTLVANRYEHTDNAYVQANVVQITPQVGGTVVAIGADDTDRVKAGQVLVKLDPADARVALDQAEAQLAQTVREVRTLFANNGTLSAQVQSRQADLTRVQSDLARAQDDVQRRSPLVATGAVGKEEFPARAGTAADRAQRRGRGRIGAGRRARATGIEPVADRWHLGGRAPERGARPRRVCARPTWPCSARP